MYFSRGGFNTHTSQAGSTDLHAGHDTVKRLEIHIVRPGKDNQKPHKYNPTDGKRA
jgi:hypothetical protein